MAIPLTKTLSLADYEDLMPELHIVDRWFTSAQEQNHQRKWEYSMALRAMNVWRDQSKRAPFVAYDIGGAGSPFINMVQTDERWAVIDPDQPPPNNYRLEEFVCAGTELADVVTCLSVLEHVDDLDQFLYHLGCLVAPGGLLFLTMDACGCDGSHYSGPNPLPDEHHFHWMRKRIFTVTDWAALIHRYHLYPTFRPFGGEDGWAYNGATVAGGYTFASLALVKRA